MFLKWTKNILEMDNYETRWLSTNFHLAENFKDGENVSFFALGNRIKQDEYFKVDVYQQIELSETSISEKIIGFCS